MPFFPAEDEKLRASSLVHRRGGNGPNTLEVLQQLMEGHGEKLSLSLCSVLPSATSLAAEQIRQSLGPHIDLSCCIYRPERTEAASSYIIRSLETGSRTIINYNGLPEMSIEEFRAAAEKVEEEACWFHFEVSHQCGCSLPHYFGTSVIPNVAIHRAEFQKPLFNASSH